MIGASVLQFSIRAATRHLLISGDPKVSMCLQYDVVTPPTQLLRPSSPPKRARLAVKKDFQAYQISLKEEATELDPNRITA